MAKQLPDQSPLRNEYDVIVVGSGAGALATAVRAAYLGLSVIVLEKTSVIGGTSAWSGGWLWIPHNPLAVRAGINESSELPRQYIKSVTGAEQLDERVEQFLAKGPEMVSFFEEHTALNFVDGNAVPDFHDCPGHALGGRSVAAAPFDGRLLGPWKHHLRAPLDPISLWGMGIASGADLKHFFNATRHIKSMLYVTRRVTRHFVDLVKYGRATQLVNGNALIAGLLKSAVDLGVHIQTNYPVTRLLAHQGKVTGVVVKSSSAPEQQINSRLAVVLATGGFPHDKVRQKTQFSTKVGSQHFSAAPKTNTGDGLNIAEAAGAYVRNDLADAGAWSPVSLLPSGADAIHFPHLIERAKPGIIAVDPNGKRFTSEADSYHDFMRAVQNATPEGQEPHCWLIADHKAQRRWGLGASRPFPFPTQPYEKNGYLLKAKTISELAQLVNLPADELQRTIQEFNQDATTGHDRHFSRGESPYNRVQGDMENRPNPSLAPLQEGPFYAVKIVSGSLGTFAGLDTNHLGQVKAQDGVVISGLYAAGNDMSSIFNGHYPSGGITLGPAMTFGYIIANYLAANQHQESETTQVREEVKHAVL